MLDVPSGRALFAGEGCPFFFAEKEPRRECVFLSEGTACECCDAGARRWAKCEALDAELFHWCDFLLVFGALGRRSLRLWSSRER